MIVVLEEDLVEVVKAIDEEVVVYLIYKVVGHITIESINQTYQAILS